MHLLLSWFLLLLLAILTPSLAIVPPQERAALVELFESCGGHLWLHHENWLDGDPCEQAWYGVGCDAANTTVLVLDTSPRLAFNILDCELPSSLGNLTNLTQLYLSNDIFHSRLHGTLPSSLQNLQSLRCFYVSHGELSGPIPAWLATLPMLQGLFLRHNSFSGDLPDLSPLIYLQDFWFDTQSGGGVSGSVDSLAQLPFLRNLHMENNNLTGTLPPALCALGKHCHASGNRFECPSQKCCDVNPCTEAGSSRLPVTPTAEPSPLPDLCTRHQ